MTGTQLEDGAKLPPVRLLALPGQVNWESLATSDLLATTPTVTAQESLGHSKQIRHGGMNRHGRKLPAGRLMLVSHNVNSITGQKM